MLGIRHTCIFFLCHFAIFRFCDFAIFFLVLSLVSCKFRVGSQISVGWISIQESYFLLILECLFACLKDREAFQIKILLFGVLPCLWNKQTNSPELTKNNFLEYLSNPKQKSENRKIARFFFEKKKRKCGWCLTS